MLLQAAAAAAAGAGGLSCRRWGVESVKAKKEVQEAEVREAEEDERRWMRRRRGGALSLRAEKLGQVEVEEM